MCKIGDVMNAALPSSLKLASESRIIVHPDFDGDTGDLNTKENLIISSSDKHSEFPQRFY